MKKDIRTVLLWFVFLTTGCLYTTDQGTEFTHISIVTMKGTTYQKMYDFDESIICNYDSTNHSFVLDSAFCCFMDSLNLGAMYFDMFIMKGADTIYAIQSFSSVASIRRKEYPCRKAYRVAFNRNRNSYFPGNQLFFMEN